MTWKHPAAQTDFLLSLNSGTLHHKNGKKDASIKVNEC